MSREKKENTRFETDLTYLTRVKKREFTEGLRRDVAEKLVDMKDTLVKNKFGSEALIDNIITSLENDRMSQEEFIAVVNLFEQDYQTKKDQITEVYDEPSESLSSEEEELSLSEGSEPSSPRHGWIERGIQHYEKKLSQANDAIDELSDKLETCERRLRGTEKKIAKSGSHSDDLFEDLDDILAEKDQLTKEIELVQKEIKDYHKKVDFLDVDDQAESGFKP